MLKNTKRSPFSDFSHYETTIKISHFLKKLQRVPLQFLKFCNRMDVKKSQRVPSFTVFGIVRFFKGNNFVLKLGFLRPSTLYQIFVLFFLTGVFSMRLF